MTPALASYRAELESLCRRLYEPDAAQWEAGFERRKG